MTDETKRTGFFGKIPQYADFIRLNAGGYEIYQLDQWFQKSLYFAGESYGVNWKIIYQNAPGYSFIFSPEITKRIIAGVYIHSTDKSGRKFPFIIFATFDVDNEWLLSVRYSQFFKEAQKIVQNLNPDVDKSEIITQVIGLDAYVKNGLHNYKENYINVLSSKTGFEFWSELFGGFDDKRKCLLIQNLIEWIKPIRQTNSRTPSTGIRFPLTRNTGQEEYLIAFWIEAMNNLLAMKNVAYSYFWNTQSNTQPGLFVFKNQPSPKSYSYLINPDEESDYMWNLLIDYFDNRDDVYNQLKIKYKPILNEPHKSLAMILDDLKHINI